MNKVVKTKGRKAGKAMISALVAVALLTSGTTMLASADMREKATLGNDGKFYTDYNTHDEAMEAAEKLNEQIAEEGNVLLKNDGMLPMSVTNYVSVFGTAQDALIGGGKGSVAQSLEDAGFRVNPALRNFYESDEYANSGSTSGAGFSRGGAFIGTESLAFGPQVETSLSLYKDAAVVVFARNGGEGSDPARVTTEKNDDTDNVDGWEHENLAKDAEGNEYKHYLQLTDSELELLDYVKARFDKIVVVLNTSNIMEMYNLQNDPSINAILLMERPGATGVNALGRILSGAVNPSGRTGDEWYRDFSADPTWMNFGNNGQTGTVELTEQTTGGWGRPSGTELVMASNNTNTFSYYDNATGITGVSYEEGIYMGYKYYETVYAEIINGSIAVDAAGKLVAKGTAGATTGQDAADKWWNANVVYPFGYGLSYTEFEMTMGALYTNESLSESLGATVTPDKFASSVGNPAEIDKLYVPVTVENTGNYAGKQVVQLYVTAPYTAGEVEKSYVKLVGYGKTDMLEPGESQTIVVSFNVQDMASFDYNDANKNEAKTYELDEGEYEIKLMDNAHDEIGSASFTISGEEAAVLAADDFSGNAVGATDFSNINSEYYTILDPAMAGGKYFGGEKMTIMSRKDMVGTAPDAHKTSDYIILKACLDYLDAYCNVDADAGIAGASIDASTQKWYIPDTELKELMKGWSQATAVDDQGNPISTTDAKRVTETVEGREDGMCDILLRDMAGVEFYVTQDGEQVVNPKWTEFMNQLTFNELWRIITQCSQSTCAVPSIGKLAARNIDGPNSTAGMSWADETCVANTWNTDLAYKQGVMVGNLYTLYGYTTWYGPALNQHRSPFGGRNNEYYSSDALHSGYMAAAAVSGCESRGVNCYVKHFTLNDQETNRTNIATFADEQNIRENYMPQFQMALQEGGSSGLMMTFSRIGIVAGPANYVALNEIVRAEWGWNGVIGTDFFPYRQSGFTVGTEGEEDYYKFVGGQTTNTDLMIRTGGVHPLGNDATCSGTWNSTIDNPITGGKGAVMLKTGESGAEQISNLQWYYMRLQAMRILYVYGNSNNIDNGVLFGDVYTPIYDYVDSSRQPQPAVREVSYDAKTGEAKEIVLTATEYELGEGNVATYSISDGKLPAGLALNTETGVISGTPTEAGTFEFTVSATNLHNHGEVNVTLNVATTLTLVGNTTIELGGALTLSPRMENLDADNYNSVVYSATGLPAGASIDATTGMVTGTPTEAGTYDVVFTITATRGTGANAVKEVYNLKATISVTEEEYDVKAAISALEAQVKDLEEAIADVTAGGDVDLSEIEADIAALEKALETANTEIAGLKDSVGDNADVTALEATVAELETNIEALQTRIAALEAAADAPAKDTPAESGSGCGSAISATGIAMIVGSLAALAAAVAIFRKRNNR